MFIIKLLSQHVSGIICPSSGDQDLVLLHMVFCTGCAVCGYVELGRKVCAVIRCLLTNFYLNMFRASLCPSSGEQDRVLLHMVFCTGCTTQLHTTTASTTSAEHHK